MEITKLEQGLQDIEQIERIESIEFKEIYYKTNGKRHSIPGFIIIYGEPLKIMYMTANDKYFDEYVKRIKQLYLEEKNKVLREDIKGKEYIEIDPTAKELFENGNITNKEYENIESYNEPLFQEEDRFKAIFPMLEFFLRDTIKILGLYINEIELAEENGTYYLNVHFRDEVRRIELDINENNNSWKVTLTNILADSIPIEMELNIKDKKIESTCKIEDFKFYDFNVIGIKDDKALKERRVFFQGRIMHQEDSELERTTPKDIKYVDDKDLIWYEAPWNGLIGTNTTRIDLDDNQLQDIRFVNIIDRDNTLYIRDIKSKYLNKKDESININLDRLDKTTIGIKEKDNTLLETSINNNYYYEAVDYKGDRRILSTEQDSLNTKRNHI